jgi:hypothetical protein
MKFILIKYIILQWIDRVNLSQTWSNMITKGLKYSLNIYYKMYVSLFLYTLYKTNQYIITTIQLTEIR